MVFLKHLAEIHWILFFLQRKAEEFEMDRSVRDVRQPLQGLAHSILKMGMHHHANFLHYNLQILHFANSSLKDVMSDEITFWDIEQMPGS